MGKQRNDTKCSGCAKSYIHINNTPSWKWFQAGVWLIWVRLCGGDTSGIKVSKGNVGLLLGGKTCFY